MYGHSAEIPLEGVAQMVPRASKGCAQLTPSWQMCVSDACIKLSHRSGSTCWKLRRKASMSGFARLGVRFPFLLGPAYRCSQTITGLITQKQAPFLHTQTTDGACWETLTKIAGRMQGWRQASSKKSAILCTRLLTMIAFHGHIDPLMELMQSSTIRMLALEFP